MCALAINSIFHGSCLSRFVTPASEMYRLPIDSQELSNFRTVFASHCCAQSNPVDASGWGALMLLHLIKELAKKSCLIRFAVTFFISGYKCPASAEARCVLDIDLSADPGIEESPAQWNEAEKQHIKNHQMKRLLCLSELLCVLRPLRVSVFLFFWGRRAL